MCRKQCDQRVCTGCTKVKWAVMLTVASFAFSFGNAQAAPEFTFTEDWNVSLSRSVADVGETLAGAAAFGALATHDGQELGLDADFAFAKAFGQGEGGDISGNDPFAGSGRVEFSREFSLSGSPGGWAVRLFGVLRGQQSAEGVAGGAGVLASATIEDTDLFEDPEIMFRQVTETDFLHDPIKETVLRNLITEPEEFVILPDGVYTISGVLSVGADSIFGTATSNFFDPFTTTRTFKDSDGNIVVSEIDRNAGWEVGLQATPVPLPAAAWMGIFMLGGLGGTQIIRRRQLAA